MMKLHSICLHLLWAICLEKYVIDPLIQVMREIETQTNEIW